MQMRIIKTWEGHGMVKQNEYATIIAKHSHENKVAASHFSHPHSNCKILLL